MVKTAQSQECSWLSLVEAVEQAIGHPLAPSVREAFVQVDRRPFVPHYYVQQNRTFVEQEAGPEIYEDRAFVTQLDERGVPNSSSSQPSLMAQMLEALHVRPGQRVLEVGTGTGYNAALLAALVGKQGHIVSVDIAAGLVKQASLRLKAWPWVETATVDGLAGYPNGAPYDCIIATGGTPTIPQAWAEQLAVGGSLLGSLTLPLSTPTPLYRMQKDANGNLHGSFLATPAFFMPLYQHSSRKMAPDFAFYDTLPVCERAWTTLDLPRLFKDPGLALWVNQQIAGLRVALRSVGASSPQVRTCLLLPGCMLTVLQNPTDTQSFEIEVRGRELVWSRWLAAYREWDSLGRPTPERYRLTVNHEGHFTMTRQEA